MRQIIAYHAAINIVNSSGNRIVLHLTLNDWDSEDTILTNLATGLQVQTIGEIVTTLVKHGMPHIVNDIKIIGIERPAQPVPVSEIERAGNHVWQWSDEPHLLAY